MLIRTFCLLAVMAVTGATSHIAAAQNPYGLDTSLSQVSNWEEFRNSIRPGWRDHPAFDFTPEEKAKLIDNGFVVTARSARNWPAEQFFHIYESSHYGESPKVANFVTSDCILQLYHLYFNYVLRTVEAEELLPELRVLVDGMLTESVHQYDTIRDPEFKSAALKNVAFFGVAAKMLDTLNGNLPEAAKGIVAEEYAKVIAHASRAPSAILADGQDYTQYIPRGHYTRSAELESYFLVMMWFGQGSFPARTATGERCDECVREALLMTQALFHGETTAKPLIEKWDRIYAVTAAFAGMSDFNTPHDFDKLMRGVYSERLALTDLTSAPKLEEFTAAWSSLPPPRIRHQAVGMSTGRQFRLMGQRYIHDSYILQELTNWPERPWPKGLDVLAVLGSTRAAELLDTLYHEPDKWNLYLPKRDTLKQEFSERRLADSGESLYHAWLDVLRALIAEPDPAAPGFAHTVAWTDKELSTSLASWAEGRHDIILYANASTAEGDAGMEQHQPKGYVEPVPEVFAALGRLFAQSRGVLSANGVERTDMDTLGQHGQNLCEALAEMARKELRSETLSAEEFVRIQYLGSELEMLSTDIVNLDWNMPAYNWEGKQVDMAPHRLRYWGEITGPDRDLAVIADVHTSQDQCLEEAVGHCEEIYVVVPIDGQLRLTRGGVFSYYEFTYPSGHRLTDEAWQEMLRRSLAPPPPAWTGSFRVP